MERRQSACNIVQEKWSWWSLTKVTDKITVKCTCVSVSPSVSLFVSVWSSCWCWWSPLPTTDVLYRGYQPHNGRVSLTKKHFADGIVLERMQMGTKTTMRIGKEKEKRQKRWQVPLSLLLGGAMTMQHLVELLVSQWSYGCHLFQRGVQPKGWRDDVPIWLLVKEKWRNRHRTETRRLTVCDRERGGEKWRLFYSPGAFG